MKRRIISLVLGAALLSACANENIQISEDNFRERMREASVPFELPSEIPYALVDQSGYDTGAEKTVLFRTALPGDSFEIRNTEDDSVVYSGSITRGEGASGQVSSGRFTDFQTPGSYYIYTEENGSSYAFSLYDGVMKNLADEALLSFKKRRCGYEEDEGTACHTMNARLRDDPTLEYNVSGGWHTDEEGNRDVKTVCLAMRDLLTAFEYYPSRFEDTDENGVPDILDEALYAAEWLMKMQRGDGSVYAGVLTGGNAGSANLTLQAPSAEAAIRTAETLAHFAYLYEQYDKSVSSKALRAAGKAYEAFEELKTPYQDKAAFAAAAELYRVTGAQQYETVLSAYFAREDFETVLEQDDDFFAGGIAYMSSRQPVNVRVCDSIMETVRSSASEIRGRADRADYLVADSDMDQMLRDMRRLAIANYMVYNHAYEEVIADHIHFLAGRNPKAVNYLSGDTEFTYLDTGEESVMISPVRSALLVLLAAA